MPTVTAPEESAFDVTSEPADASFTTLTCNDNLRGAPTIPTDAVEKMPTLPEPRVAPALEEAACTALIGMAMICRTPVCGFVCTAFKRERQVQDL